MANDPRIRLTEALRAGCTREALRIAARLARAGAWDDAVAATVFLHGRAHAPERVQADAWLEVPLAALRVEASMDDRAAWDELLAALVAAGRVEDAVAGLTFAADAGVVDLAAYLGLVLRLVECGELRVALEVTTDAVRRHPRSAHAWSVLGWLWLELGDDARAAGACVRALDLRPGLGEALLTCSLLAARAGDPDTAAGLLDQARRSGVPLTILEGYARLAA